MQLSLTSALLHASIDSHSGKRHTRSLRAKERHQMARDAKTTKEEENPVSTRLRSGGSLAADSRRSRLSEDGSPRSVPPIPLARELDTPESKANSNPRGRHLGRDSWLKARPWQLRTTILITLLGPPAASLILLAVDYFEYWRAVPFNLGDFLAVFFLFAIPVGYVFGAIPLLFAASLYCALLTARSGLQQWRPWTRACVAGICGGLASGVWFWAQLRTAWGIYALVGALVMAALSLATPQLPRSLEKAVQRSASGLNQRDSSARGRRDRLGHEPRSVPPSGALGRAGSSEERQRRSAIRPQETRTVS